MSVRRELLKGLTKEQYKKLKTCKSSDEILSLAKAEGVELTDEQLNAISGGGCIFDAIDQSPCPQCMCSKDVVDVSETVAHCNKCNIDFDPYWEVN